MNGQLTVGVIGHVDHGKTSLVRALTGTDTDRLAEEKERGLSIVLGYAWLDTARGIIDLIDAPGHESFIRTMIAGATGIDAVLITVAADEGIKPQTREHFDIAGLLGIRHGVIAITKSDLADQALLEQTLASVRDFIHGTALQDAEMVTVSSTDGTGLTEVVAALTRLFDTTEQRSAGENFYLPIDRVFTMEGFGTVATGTLRDGRINTGTEVEILPAGITATIRELQVHNQQAESAGPGQRVALNLRGIKRDQLKRGQTLTSPGSLVASRKCYARLKVLDDLPRLPKRNELIRVLYGTTDVVAKLRIVGDHPLREGQEFMALLHLQQPVIASKGEAFIVRTCSPVMTFGGGEILETSDCLRDVKPGDLEACLRILHAGSPVEQVKCYLTSVNSRAISIDDLVQRMKSTRADVSRELQEAGALIIEEFAIGSGEVDLLCGLAKDRLGAFHERESDAAGQALDAFRTMLSNRTPDPIVEYILERLVESGEIIVDANTVRLSSFDSLAGIGAEERELMDTIENTFRDSGVMTPSLDEVVGRDPLRRTAYQHLKEQGKLVTVTNASSRKLFVFHSDTIDRIKQDLAREYPAPRKFTVSDIRTLLDSSRKYVVPLLEHFDSNRLTIRQGDYRVVTPALSRQDSTRGNS